MLLTQFIKHFFEHGKKVFPNEINKVKSSHIGTPNGVTLSLRFTAISKTLYSLNLPKVLKGCFPEQN